MKVRWSANTWVLVICTAVLLLIGLDVGRRALTGGDEAAARPPQLDTSPPFAVGDRAPDFTLADRHGRKHTFSQMVKGDTLLVFSCGCSACREMQTYLAAMQKSLGPKAPPVVSVTTSPPEAEDAWIRDTGLKQKILYEPKGGTVIDSYRGHPCPRVFRLTEGLRVTWIGPSPNEVPQVPVMAYAVAKVLGVPIEGELRKAMGKMPAPGASPAPPGATKAAAPAHSGEKHSGHATH